MKISIEEPKNTVLLSTLSIGDVFSYDNHRYMVISTPSRYPSSEIAQISIEPGAGFGFFSLMSGGNLVELVGTAKVEEA